MPASNFEVGTGDHKLVGWKAGSGPVVVVLHGGPGLSEYTESLLPELSDHYTVVRYQQRGLAPSTTSGPFDVETRSPTCSQSWMSSVRTERSYSAILGAGICSCT
jgi:pimeloyl-ACP methyl ester carboxylesterase